MKLLDQPHRFPACPLRWVQLLVIMALVTTLAGCGTDLPQRAPVTGKITCGGKPVTQGTIMFIPAEGRMAIGKIQPDGSYTLTTFSADDGAVLGQHTVTIKATEVGSSAPASFEEELSLGRSGAAPSPGGTVTYLVPQKYSDRSTTPLTAEVVAGGNTLNFDLPAE